jgi:hypothetical protein
MVGCPRIFSSWLSCHAVNKPATGFRLNEIIKK